MNTQKGQFRGVALWRLVRLLVGAWTKPEGLVWSDEHQAWTKTGRGLGNLTEYTHVWGQTENGRWVVVVSYGRDLPLSDYAQRFVDRLSRSSSNTRNLPRDE